MIHAKDLANLRRCPRSYYYQKSLKVKTTKEKPYYLSLGVKMAIREWESDPTELNKAIPDHPFLSIEKSEEIKHLAFDLKRYFDYMGNKKPEKVGVTQDINVGGRLVTVSADLIYVTGNVVEVVNVKRSSPKLSYRARSEKNAPHKSVDLFLLQLMGERLYPGKIVVAAYHHLASKGDKAGKKVEFEAKNGHNIIKYSFSDASERKEMMQTLHEELKMADNVKDHFDEVGQCYRCNFAALCAEQKERPKLNRARKSKKVETNVELTPTQREAVLFTKGALRLISGAGTGKTTTIAVRAAELIMDNCDPKDILTITFTNKAAQEMEERIKDRVRYEGVDCNINDIKAYTFNAWGDRVLQDNYLELGFSVKPTLIEKIDKYDIILQVLEKNPHIKIFDRQNPTMDYKYAKGVLPSLNNLFDYIKSQLIQDPDCLKGQVEEGMEDVIFELFKQYQATLSENGLIDYQDQIRMVLNLMDSNPGAFAEENYKHIIIDEFQDTDEQQLELIIFLVNQSKFESIMIVGDDSQSIYGFRNTSKENLMKFHERYGEVKDLQLVHNFRSTKEILDLSNHINDLNTVKIEKTLISGRKPSKIYPELTRFQTKDEEYSYLADSILDLVSKKHVKNQEIALIGRTKFELFEIEPYLLKRNIPYVLDIPEPIINQPKVRMAEHLLIFMEDCETTQGIYEYMVMSGQAKDKTDDEILDMIEDYKAEMEALTDEEKLEKFYSMMHAISDEVLDIFFFGLKEKSLNFIQTISYIKKFIKYEDKRSIEKTGEKYNAVTLTTAHTSKGKEFEHVFVTMNKYVPVNAVQETIEEERRTFYVSITRAKKYLVMTSNNEAAQTQFEKEVIASRKCKFKTTVTTKTA